MDRWQITNATLVSDGRASAGGLLLEGNRIKSILKPGESIEGVLELDLHGLAVLPGLINCHDTLLSTYMPLPAPVRPFSSWLAFDNVLKSSDLFRERMLISTADLYLLGAYKNLISGTTTVLDHIPEFVREPFRGQLPVYCLEDYGIAHAVDSSSLRWGSGIIQEHARARDKNLPFIIHIAEGLDEESQESLRALQAMGALTEHTVLLSGVGLREQDLDLIADAGAHLVWAPTISKRLFGKNPPVAAALERGINVCLGTDGAMTGSGQIFAEIKQAASELEEISLLQCLQMATANGGKALRIKRGTIQPGYMADLLVLNAAGGSLTLKQVRSLDVFLVVVEGRPAFGDKSARTIFQKSGVETEQILVEKTEKLVVAGLYELVDRLERATGKKQNFPFLPVSIPVEIK